MVVLLVSMTSVAVPLPVPLAPSVIAIHWTGLAAVHGQPAGAVTATVVLSPAATADFVIGEMLYVQPGCAAWVTVYVWPAMVIVPMR